MDFQNNENVELTHKLRLLAQRGAPVDDEGRSTNAYAIRLSPGSILVDAANEAHHDGIMEVAEGDPPGALLLTSRRVVDDPKFLMHLKSDHDLPIFLHPAAAEHEELADVDVPFFNPVGAKIFRQFGLEILPTPFVTEGSVAVYGEADRGFVICGDAATTPGPDAEASPAPPRLQLPTEHQGKESDFQEFWSQFLREDRPLFSILPRRGPTYHKRRDIDALVATIGD